MAEITPTPRVGHLVRVELDETWVPEIRVGHLISVELDSVWAAQPRVGHLISVELDSLKRRPGWSIGTLRFGGSGGWH